MSPGNSDSNERTLVPGESSAASEALGESTIHGGESLPLPSAAVLPWLPGYELLRKIGQGGMGEVYLARQLNLNRLVAIKKIKGGRLAGPEMLAHFRGEAEALGRLQNQHIVQVYNVEEHHDEPYLVMEYVGGGNLLEKTARRPMAFREAAQFVAILARAMHLVHERGIVHLDLKPENILLADGDVPKISDFGLAKRLDEDTPGQTHRLVIGTPEYMSPEQATAQGRKIGPLADVYALGAILYRLLTSRTPFTRMPGDNSLGILQAIARDEPAAPRRLNPRVPRDLDTICRKCLEKDPNRRYASAAALGDDLERWLRGEPILARPVGPVVRAWKWARRHPAKVAMLAALGAVVLGLGLWLRAESRRRAGQLQEDARDLATVQAHMMEQHFADAAKIVAGALARVQGEPSLADHQRRWQRVQALVQFFVRSEEAWFRAGEERFEEGRAACEAGLQNLGIVDAGGEFSLDWWDRLPVAELSDEQQVGKLREEVYRQLLLLTYLRTVVWAGEGERKTPAAIAGYHAAFRALDQAHAYEKKAQDLTPAKTVGVFARSLRELLKWSGDPLPPWTAEEELRYRTVPEKLPTIDFFFNGTVHYYLAPRLKKINPVQAFLIQALTSGLRNDLDLQHPLETAEDNLQEAVRLDPGQYWPNFVLGRTLLAQGKTGESLMAFNACVASRPDYPVSYQFRALVLCKLAVALPSGDPQGRYGQLIQRAQDDSRRARELAEQSKNPAIFWARGEMYQVLGEVDDALESYALGLERTRELNKKVSLKAVLEQVETFARAVLKKNDRHADAYAVMALVHLTRNEPAQAKAAAQQALDIAPGHVRAKAVLRQLE
jgi:tetratricopeptide (TPR) repeat protein